MPAGAQRAAWKKGKMPLKASIKRLNLKKTSRERASASARDK